MTRLGTVCPAPKLRLEASGRGCPVRVGGQEALGGGPGGGHVGDHCGGPGGHPAVPGHLDLQGPTCREGLVDALGRVPIVPGVTDPRRCDREVGRGQQLGERGRGRTGSCAVGRGDREGVAVTRGEAGDRRARRRRGAGDGHRSDRGRRGVVGAVHRVGGDVTAPHGARRDPRKGGLTDSERGGETGRSRAESSCTLRR